MTSPRRTQNNEAHIPWKAHGPWGCSPAEHIKTEARTFKNVSEVRAFLKTRGAHIFKNPRRTHWKVRGAHNNFQAHIRWGSLWACSPAGHIKSEVSAHLQIRGAHMFKCSPTFPTRILECGACRRSRRIPAGATHIYHTLPRHRIFAVVGTHFFTRFSRSPRTPHAAFGI